MKFESLEQHSIDQIKALESAAGNFFMRTASLSSLGALETRFPVGKALFGLTELAMHGSSLADAFLNAMSRQNLKLDSIQYLAKIRKLLEFIRQVPDINALKADEEFCNKAYAKEGFFFVKGTTNPTTLVVVFTTMFNNFQVSNLIFYAFLKRYGVSILFLKDCTYFNFLNGVQGLGSNIFELSGSIEKIIRENEISKTCVTGFSSGGYASLFSSHLIPCKKYLGFSIASDLSPGSKIFPGKYFTPQVRRGIDKKHLVNLRHLAVDTKDGVDRTLVFGKESAVDCDHAMNMAGIPAIRLVGLNNCDHATIFHMICEGTFSSCIESFLS